MADPRANQPQSPEERLRLIGLGIYQNEQIIKSAKVGSDYYKQAEAALKKLREDFKKVNAEIDALRKKSRDAARAKELQKAKDAQERAEALNDQEAAAKARAKVTELEGQQASEDLGGSKSNATGYVGSGTKDKPLMLNGENYSGVYKNKTYKNGILVKETPAVIKKETKKDGVKGGAKGGEVPPAGGGPDVKELWVSYLRSTFATLEDKTQKAEIDGLLKRAKTEKWTEDTFMDALEGTVWWQTTLPSMRQFFLDTHDKRNASTFAEKMRNTMDSMLGKLETLGIQVKQIDPTTGKVTDNSEYLKGIAMKAIENGWDDDQLENYLSTQGSIVFTGGGTLGSYYDRVAQQAFLYGVPLDTTMKQTINTSLLDPTDGRDVNYWLKTVKDMAYDAPQNKAFLPALQQGRNLYEVTNSYRQQMANLLEVDSTAITWNDLMGKVIDGNSGNARTFSDFTKQLKQDPMWQYTRNAKETYSNTALDIAKMFGFMG
jgi:hypothetical protein